jgi:tetrahydromethanopterin S-methyltransferase subunit B
VEDEPPLRPSSSRQGILVIVGIVLMIVWSFWVGLIVTLVGLIAFGGFAKGKWY